MGASSGASLHNLFELERQKSCEEESQSVFKSTKMCLFNKFKKKSYIFFNFCASQMI